MHSLFLNWFNQIPVVCQQKLARIMWLLITEDISDMALSSDEILNKFKNYVLSINIPIRKAARMIMLISLFDSVMKNLPILLKLDSESFIDPELEKKLVHIEEKMWEKIINDWTKISKKYYSTDLLHLSLKELFDGTYPELY